eukprot:CAMPEP_0119399602 /NCGR_PEP_ID=MMETSP1334-20130426/141438_1 /TAXON_ID=127549 /ORGANISM="Calcidiscus leptoporus, Strain RCC1130" /LENGTH=141 /DNA_ID=CAMNT_0007423497 /DNA_START=398 /DNA_END=823 /DNA_ORIENTATION=-
MSLYPLLAGIGVAGVAYAAKGALHVSQRLRANPEAVKNLNAAAAGARAVGERFSLSSLREQFAFMKGPSALGFDAVMNRREAAQILGVRESAGKAQIKEAHRKIMLLNHPDRGGSPYIASKINEANECMMGTRSSSGSAFQ